jgi:hypothetical protein
MLARTVQEAVASNGPFGPNPSPHEPRTFLGTTAKDRAALLRADLARGPAIRRRV